MSTSIRPHLLPAALAATCAVAVVWTPWPLLMFCGWSMVAAASVDRSTQRGVAAAIIVWAAGALTVGVGATLLPGGLFSTGLAAQLAAVIACAMLRPGSLVKSLGRVRRRAALITAALGIPVAIGSAALIRGTSYSWAVWNDAVVQLVVAQRVLDSGGVNLEEGQPDPLVSTVLGWSMAPDRPDGPAARLVHDGNVQAVVTFLVIAALGVVLALITSGGVPAERRRLRVSMAAAGSFLAFSWLVSGFAVPFGFINSLFALVVLAACWLVWTDVAVRPTESAALLVIAGVVMLGTWPVLAVVPAGLVAAVVVSRRRDLGLASVRARMSAATGVTVAVAAAAAIAVPTVTRPSSVGTALADGSFVGFGPLQASVYAILPFVVACVAWRCGERARWEAAGLLVVVGAALLGLAYLSWQRITVGGAVWFYYPQKLVWMVGILTVAVVASLLLRALLLQAATPRDLVLAPVVVAIVAFAMMFAVPPQASPLVGQGPSRLAPLLSLVSDPGPITSSFRAFEPQESLAVEVLSRNGLTVLSNRRSPAGEQWVNDLALTPRSRFSGLPLRRVEGTAPLSGADGVCEVAETWGREITVLTQDSELDARVAEECPEQPVEIEVNP